MTDDPKVWVVSTTNSGRDTCYHTNPDCCRIRNRERFEKRLSQIETHREPCSWCTKDINTQRGDCLATTRKLEEMNPEDLGLSPLGERRAP